MTTAYIALGSNLGDPARQLGFALNELSTLPHCRLEAVSSAYSSAAVGPGEQADYLNAVAKVSTSLTPSQLLQAIQAIENKAGRVRTQRWGPRTLDLDIILYGQQEIQSDGLQVPHPRMSERNFVLYPLAEIAGEKMVLPCGGVLGSLLANCPLGDLVQTHRSLTTCRNFE